MRSHQRIRPRWWLFALCAGAAFWLLVGLAVARAGWSASTVSTSAFGMFGPSRLSVTAICRNSGHEAVWVAETGVDYLDIIQVGAMDGSLFYAYGRGVPGGTGSLYREIHLGPSGTGWHTYGLRLAHHAWTITIDGHVVARIADSFRTWRLHQTQVMSEGDLPFGSASCISPGSWHFGGYGPQPYRSIGSDWWQVSPPPVSL